MDVDEAFPPRNQPCGYCGARDDVRYVSGVDYVICQSCRSSRGLEPLEELLRFLGH